MAGTVAAQIKGGWHLGEDGSKPLGEIKAVLTAPPAVPPALDRARPARVVVELFTTEEKGTLANGVEYTFWMFGGTLPGPFLRVRAGDTVEIRLINLPSSHNAHSIDLRAVTGPGGGAAVTQIMPGETGALFNGRMGALLDKGALTAKAAAQRADHAHSGRRRRDRGVQGGAARPLPPRRPQHLARDGQGRARIDRRHGRGTARDLPRTHARDRQPPQRALSTRAGDPA